MTNSSRRAELADLRPNDLVRLSEVLRVESVDRHDGTLNVVAVNEKHGRRWRLGNPGTKIELLHRPKAKPAVGDLLTGHEVREIKWKRGSVLETPEGDRCMLNALGRWAGSSFGTTGFDSFSSLPGIKYRVIALGK